MRGEVKECQWCWEDVALTLFGDDADECDPCVWNQAYMWKNRKSLTLGALA